MKIMSLRATTAVALFLGATAAHAQMQQQDRDTAPGKAQVQQQDQAPSKSPSMDEPKGKASQGAGTTTEPKGKSTKGTAQKDTEPKGKSTKGTAQKDNEPKDKSTKGSAQKDEPKGRATKDSAQKKDAMPSKEKAASDRTAPSDQKARKAGTEPRAQLSEQQQTRVRETVLKQKGERVTNVNFSVSVGTRVPRSVRLAALPAAVIEIVPEYRSYRYVVVRDDVVIIDPNTYEIIYVLPGRSTTAGGGGPAALSLTDEQLAFVLRNIDLKSESRLGIGGISVGTTIARDVELREFPSIVVEKLPELRSYRYLVHENEVAFIDPRESKVVLVRESQR